MYRLRVCVFASEEMQQSNKRLFERIVEVNDNLKIDYVCIVNALTLLYGENCIINFSIHRL
jgi:hypothetical protein